MLDQDSGGAIRAAGRCDLYMGVGPQAEQLAGHQLYPGRLYYLALRPEAVALGVIEPLHLSLSHSISLLRSHT